VIVDTVRVALFRRHLPVVAATGSGAFAERGLAPQWRVVRSSGEQRRMTEAGDVDLAHTAIDNVAAWHAPEQPWAVLRVVDLGIPHQLVAHPEVATLEDLRGARVGVDSARSGFVTMLQAIFADAGLGDEVELVEVGALQQRLDALRRREVDACLLGAEQLRAALAAGAQVLLSLNEHFPGYPGLTVTGVVPRVAARPEAAQRYVQVLDETAGWCFEPARRAEVVGLAGQVLELDPDAAADWYDGELARWSGLVDVARELPVLERAWRATGRVGDDEPVPGAWYRPDLVATA
jgi:ABC-type nitrate/sulfonate/bicarbonate transport system substrate-binding protein